MNPTKKTLSFLVTSFVAVGLASNAIADRTINFNVKYDQVVRHGHDLEYIANDLKDCFRDQFRSTRLYGKMISKTNRIRSRARSLHRHGVSRGTCNWQNEIKQLEGFVAGLRGLLDEAVHLSQTGYERPLCPNAVRTAYKLIGKAEWHVAGLRKALYQVNRPVYNRPIFQPAPSCAPTNFYRSSNNRNDFNYKYNNNRRNVYATSSRYQPRNGFDTDRNGFAVNVGGFKFYVNK